MVPRILMISLVFFTMTCAHINPESQCVIKYVDLDLEQDEFLIDIEALDIMDMASDKTPTHTLQLASFQTEAEANGFAEAMDPDCFIETVDLGTRGVWYRVYNGKFDSFDEAQKYGKEHFSVYIVKQL